MIRRSSRLCIGFRLSDFGFRLPQDFGWLFIVGTTFDSAYSQWIRTHNHGIREPMRSLEVRRIMTFHHSGIAWLCVLIHWLYAESNVVPIMKSHPKSCRSRNPKSERRKPIHSLELRRIMTFRLSHTGYYQSNDLHFDIFNRNLSFNSIRKSQIVIFLTSS